MVIGSRARGAFAIQGKNQGMKEPAKAECVTWSYWELGLAAGV